MILRAPTAARALEDTRREILERVDSEGPVPVATLPVAWPLTRHHLRLVVRDLARDGLAVYTRPPGSTRPLLSVTPAGRSALRQPEEKG